MSEWQPFRGEYEKTFYQIRFPDGDVRKHCFPNAGYMHALDGSGLMWGEKSQIEFKRCDCGEKWSGCSEMETGVRCTCTNAIVCPACRSGASLNRVSET
jgi:hypothetical protein